MSELINHLFQNYVRPSHSLILTIHNGVFPIYSLLYWDTIPEKLSHTLQRRPTNFACRCERNLISNCRHMNIDGPSCKIPNE